MTKLFLVAVSILAVTVQADAADLKTQFQSGMMAYEKGDYDRAITLLEQAAEIDPNFAPTFNALGMAYNAKKAPIEEVSWFFVVATQIDPKYSEAYGNLCRAYFDRQYFDDAETACLDGLAADPDHLPTQMTLGWLYLLGKQEPGKALTYFEPIRDRLRDNPTVLFGMGIAYEQLKEHGQALEIITLLRSMGKEDLAAQLEGEMRSHWEKPQLPVDAYLDQPQPTGPGQIVPGTPRQAPPAVAPQTGPISGAMQIRLKGKLNSVGGMPPASQDVKHPGSL